MSALRTCARLALLALPALALACGQEPRRPRSAILVTLDTTNASALDCYGEDRGITPRLAELAAECVVYERARTVAPLTLPAHASMLTGLWPPRHGVRDNGLTRLPASARTLAERAREAGMATAAFVSAAVLAPAFGLDQGFERYDAPAAGDGDLHFAERSAADTTRAAQDWLRARDRERPFFLWVHYFDPHAPYEPPERARHQAGGHAYLGEVAAVDRALGDLLDLLRAQIDLDDCVLAVVGDHGESLGRHGEPTHSLLCYEATVRVPFLLRLPEGERAGTRSSKTVSVVDVHDTFLAVMGLPLAAGGDGRDLAAGPVPEERGVYFESYTGWLHYGFSPLAGWASGGRKLLASSDSEVYDLARDPREERDRIAAEAEFAARAHAAIAAVHAAPRLAPEESGVDAAAVEAVRALGYAGAGDPRAELPPPDAAGELTAPAAGVGEMVATYEAVLLGGEGRLAEAIGRLAAIADENPRNVYARSNLGAFQWSAGDAAGAIETLEALLDDGHERGDTQRFLGRARERLGERAAARAHYERALELLPGDAELQEALERLAES